MSGFVPPVEMLKDMILRENELRCSTEWQHRFDAAERRADTDWLECVAELQLQVVREFSCPDVAVHALRTAQALYPQEPFFAQVPLHVRYNRARNGPLSVGREAPPVTVYHLDGTALPLFDLGGDSEPLVLVCGSFS